MSTFSSKLILYAILFVLAAASGFWLRKTGSPYATAWLTVHKLLALALVVLGVVAFFQYQQKGVPLPFGQWALVGATAFVLVAAFVSGAMLAAPKAGWALLPRLHAFTSVLALLGSLATAWLLLKK